jgi:protein-tyrosine phosphatase
MRDLSWDGYRNARDLGGLPTPLSATGATQPGRIARGPRRELLTDAGWADAARWGLSTVIDLRCVDEIGTHDGDPAISPRAIAGVTVLNVPTEDQTDPEFQRVCFPILDSPAYWRHTWQLQPDLVRAALQAIADAAPGMLVHCSAGRDRTGMISALLLGNAGVAPDVVAADYAASVRAMAGAASHAPTVDRQAAWTPTQSEAWLAETTPIVREAAACTSEAFDLIGVPQSVRGRLRALLTDQ